jgi:hypothetical protein
LSRLEFADFRIQRGIYDHAYLIAALQQDWVVPERRDRPAPALPDRTWGFSGGGCSWRDHTNFPQTLQGRREICRLKTETLKKPYFFLASSSS